jgi:hypothetical protein
MTREALEATAFRQKAGNTVRKRGTFLAPRTVETLTETTRCAELLES